MKLSEEQSSALKAIQAWLKRPQDLTFVLAGYAGTGKTTLLQQFINGQNKEVTCCAPTGKAASVLQSKLNNATVTTVHRLLYKPMGQSVSRLELLQNELRDDPSSLALAEAIEEEKALLAKQGLGFALRGDSLLAPGQLVVVDEASMVTKRMQTDLLNSMAKVIYVGDPGQLPPVNDEGFFRTHPPNAMLTSVQRQALDNPIIRASMDIREGRSIGQSYDAGPFRRMEKENLKPEEWLQFDQVLTGMNNSRRRINRYFRKQLGHSDTIWPRKEEKLICLANKEENGIRFINGVTCTARSDFYFDKAVFELKGDILYEGQIAHRKEVQDLPFRMHYDDELREESWERPPGIKLDFAYAITVHKAQGSEWDRVLLADDGMQVTKTEFRRQWLYTAVTRARKELVWLF